MKFESFSEFASSGATYNGPATKRPQRHITSKYSFGDKKFILKKFGSEDQMKTEAAAYDALTENVDVLLPPRHFARGTYTLYDFITATSQCTPREIISDWTKIHARRDTLEIFPCEKPSHEEVEVVIARVRADDVLYGAERQCYADAIERGRRFLTHPKNRALIHGDLHLGNVVATRRGRFYLDLEFCGIKDPLIDLVPTLLFHSDWNERVIDAYSTQSTFKDDEIREGASIQAVFRGVSLIAIHKARAVKEEARKRARNIILNSLNILL